MANKVEILNLDINTSALISKMTETRAEIEKLQAAQKTLKDNNQSTSDSFTKNAVEIGKLQSSYNAQKSVVTQLTTSQNSFATATSAITSAINKENTSIISARENNTQLLALRNQLNLKTIEGQNALTQINSKLDENNAFIKNNVSAYEQQKIGIGDYKNAISGAIGELGLFNGTSKEFSQVSNLVSSSFAVLKKDFTEATELLKGQKLATEGMTTAQAAGTVVTNTSTAAFKLLRLAIAATGIGLLVIGVTSLIAAFKSSEEGQNKFAKILGVIGAITGNLVDVLANLGEKIISVFENPKKAIEDFANIIKQNIINRFTGLLELLPQIGKAIGQLFSGEFSEAAKTATNAVGKVATGVEDVTGKIGKATDAVKGFAAEQLREGKLAAQVADMRAKADKIERDLIVEKASLEGKIADNRLKARQIDQYSAAERKQFLIEAQKLSDGLIVKETEYLKLRANAIKLENTFSKTNKENLTKEQEAIAAVISQETARTNAKREVQRELNKVSKEQEGIDKAAADKAKEAAQKAIDARIQKSNEELSLFIQNQGFKKKSLADEIAFDKEVLDKKLAILKQEYDAKKITQTAFQTQSLALTNEFAKKQADIAISEAQRELENFKQNHQIKIDKEKFFTEEKLNQIVSENNSIQAKEIEFQSARLEQGVINQQQYNDAVDLINENTRIKNEDAQKTRDEAKVEKQAIDLENQRLIDEEKFTNDFNLQIEREDIRYKAEIAAAEKTGASKDLIEQKHAQVQKKINDAKEEAKLQAAATTFGNIATLLGEETAAGKAASIAAATISTYEGATKAYSSLSGIPIVGPALGAVAAAVVVAAGVANVKKITSTKVPTRADGGTIPKLSSGVINNGANLSIPLSNGDDTLAYVGQGEVILNKQQQDAAGGSMFFKGLGVPGFAGGGFVGGNSNLGSQRGQKIDVVLLANLIAQANKSLPVPVVSVQDINYTQNAVRVIEQSANF